MHNNPYLNIEAKQLNTWRRQKQKRLQHKRKVMASHKPGTAWHARAAREAATLEHQIAQLDEALKQKR